MRAIFLCLTSSCDSSGSDRSPAADSWRLGSWHLGSWALAVGLLSLLAACGDGDVDDVPFDSGTRDVGPVPCGPGRQMCGAICVDTQRDTDHCGACGRMCSSEQLCVAGACAEVAACPPGQALCADACVDVLANTAHCGRCDAVCAGGAACMDGACAIDSCAIGQTRCEDVCVDISADSAHCGGCGLACEEGQSCRAGSCATSCADGQAYCMNDDGGRCIDLMNDSDHCGGCGAVCATGQTCDRGGCGCGDAESLCGAECVNVNADPAHCGACNAACPDGEPCVDGACACPMGESRCGGRCVNIDVSNAHCGACGVACAANTETCSAGVCESTCGAGGVFCGGGCVDPTADDAHCGGCDNVCGSGRGCNGGACRPSNDVRANATPLALSPVGETTVNGSTLGATHDGPAVACNADGPNVWFVVDLPTRGVLWFDTAGSSYDTAIFVTDSAGAAISPRGATSPGMCNDDCCAIGGDFTSFVQSCAGASLAAGRYYVSVGGYFDTDVGDFTLHAQFLPATGFLYEAPLEGMGVTSETVLVGTSEHTPMCVAGAVDQSGEDMRWFAACGGEMALLSLCASDGASWTRDEGMGLHDPVLSVVNASGELACDDDGPISLDCRGLGGNSNYGSRLSDVSMQRGIHAVLVDSRGPAGSGMTYRLAHDVPTH